jgi:hypothetical protein
MQFTLSTQRRSIGQTIQVEIGSALPAALTRATTTLDGTPIGDDALPTGTTSYARTFDGQPARIGATHTLVVTALSQDGNSESAVKMWTDDV